MMAGGYTSFQGMDGWRCSMARLLRSACLSRCLPGPDGFEAPEGLDPVVIDASHPVMQGLTSAIPYVLGMNRVVARANAETKTLVHCTNRGRNLPLLSVREYGAGRSLAWMTDIGPHWLSDAFMCWEGYDRFMTNMVHWLVKNI